MRTFHAADALTALAAAEDPNQAIVALRAAEAVLGSDGGRFRPLMVVLCQRAVELSRLRRLAGEDELTGVANRRGFRRALDREIARLSRGGHRFAVLLLDLDGLKLINDAHGHQAGDRAIVGAVEAIGEAIRATDLCARLGGDELAVLLPEIDREGIAATAERVRDAVERRRVAGAPLRISLGWAVAETGGVTGDELLGLADLRLYSDKHRRRSTRRALAA